MDLTLTSEEQAFRDEVRTWLEENHPGEMPEGEEAGFVFSREWQRKMHEAGWAGISWPKEYGGRGASLIEQAIFSEEMARTKAPRPANVLGLVMGGPVVIATVQPLPTPPTTFSSGIRASSMKISLNSASPVIWRSGRTSTPGACMSTMRYVSPA